MTGLPCIIHIHLPDRSIDFQALASKNTCPGEKPYRLTIFGSDNITPLGHFEMNTLPTTIQGFTPMQGKIRSWLQSTSPWADDVRAVTFAVLQR